MILVGADLPPGEFLQFLKERDVCFGNYLQTARECDKCRAPVIVDDKLVLLKEACQAETTGAANTGALKKLSTQQVIDRIEQGKTIEEIFEEVLNGLDPEMMATVARNSLNLRLNYMKSIDIPAPKLPTAKELKEYVRNKKDS